jgi:hypothetical protein
MFKAIGMLVTALGLIAAAGLALLVIQSIPDIQRYLRIRAMSS